MALKINCEIKPVMQSTATSATALQKFHSLGDFLSLTHHPHTPLSDPPGGELPCDPPDLGRDALTN